MSTNDDEAMDISSPASSDQTSSKNDDGVIIDEYNAWRKTDRKSIKLRETRTDEDGKTSLEFSIEASEQKFTLHCPPQYPSYSDDDNFFVEADSGLQLWCNALNEYLLDTDGHLSLANILNKGLSLYSSTDASRENASDKWMPREAVSFDDSDDEGMGDEDVDGCGEDDEDDDDRLGRNEDDDDDEDDDHLEDILDNDLSWELEISRRKKRWRLREGQLRAERFRANTSEASSSEDKSLHQLYHDPQGRQPKQVFTDAGASGILINDLVSIMESATTSGIEADSVDDNIFQWNVKIRNFAAQNSLLDRDCQDLKAKFGYDCIELQLDFSMDLYPFFPPLVKVIRPRLQGSMMLRVTTMEILKLSFWNPARDMKSVLFDIKAFLETWARLDTNSERNDRARYPDGAYINIDHYLLRLALVSEIVPRANKKYAASPPPAVSLPSSALEPVGGASGSGGATSLSSSLGQSSSSSSKADTKKKDEGKMSKFSKLYLFHMMKDNSDSSSSKAEEKAKKKAMMAKNMARGIGYSNYLQKGWDVKAFMAAQKEKDKQIELVLAKIHTELKKLNAAASAAKNLPDVVAVDGTAQQQLAASPPSSELTAVEVEPRLTGSSRRKRKHSPDEAAASLAGTAAAAAAAASVVDSVPGEAIDPLTDLYAVLEGSALLPFLESKLQANSFLEICNHAIVYKCVIAIIREIASQSHLVSLLGSLPDQAASIHSLLLALESQAQILLEKIGKSSANGSVPKTGKSDKSADKAADDKLARDFVNLSRDVTKALQASGQSHQAAQKPSTSTSTSTNAAVALASTSSTLTCPTSSTAPKATDTYKEHMKHLQFRDDEPFSTTGANSHAFSAAFAKAGKPSSQIILRVAQEVSSLSTSLPLDFSSSIFLRTDDNHITLMRVLITGPEGTPYSGGCYLFDFYLPPEYPQSPPQINFRTTGNGSVRFNPNLYSCGKVCLSLLGTWEGAPGEQWNETSTMLQVLVSIQSLILCSEPYYNEPGFERLYGTTQGDAESDRYSEEVFRNNLKYAVLGQLANPPEGFEDVIRAHFYFKRDALLAEYEKMAETYSRNRDVKKQLANVRRELMRLAAPKLSV